MANPIEIKGKIKRSGSEISIIIEEDSEQVTTVFENDQPVSAIVWDARSLSELPLVEQLSQVQQLERSVIVQGLRSKGAITAKEDFLKRLSTL